MSKPEPRDVSDELAELRELVRDAHGAIKDLGRLLDEYRRIARDAANDARARAQQAAAAELADFAEHLQREANRMSAQLNRAVHEAQRNVVRQLEVADMGETKEGRLWVRFKGAPFDDQVPTSGIDPGAHCPACGKLLDAATDPTGQGHRPDPGDLSVCYGCGVLLQYAGEPGALTLTTISDEQLDAYAAEDAKTVARLRRLSARIKLARQARRTLPPSDNRRKLSPG